MHTKKNQSIQFCIFILITLIFLVTSCNTSPDSQEEVNDNAVAGFSSAEQDQWLQTNQMGEYSVDVQNWDTIEAAAIEEGSLVLYTDSSSLSRVADTWAKLYPDITLIFNDNEDISVILEAEQKAGNVFGDIWYSSDGAYIVGEMLPYQYVWNFVPDTLAGRISPEYSEPLLAYQFEPTILAYNSELNDSCPITNLWELTQPEWKGKVYIEDPLTDTDTMNQLLTYVYHEGELETAYLDLYGSEPVLDADTPDAGWLWLKRFVRNAPIPQFGNTEVKSAFATPGMNDSYLAFTSYANYADVLDGTLTFEPCWGVQPILGIQNTNYLGIINLAPHPNAAKLFIRFITSEENRNTWITFGHYFPDSTYVVPESQKSLDEILEVTWFIEEQFTYDQMIQTLDFYLLNMSAP